MRTPMRGRMSIPDRPIPLPNGKMTGPIPTAE
jgi:hypothetical protein